MRIKWLGHSCFLITSEKGVRIVTDPFTPGNTMSYGSPRETADVVLVSHDHSDHANVSALLGKPEVVREGGSRIVHGIPIKGVPSYHDMVGGKQRGSNVIFCFTVDGVRLCHLGDLGHRLSAEQMGQIGGVDVLMVPVGGSYTVDAVGATEVCEQLRPKLIFPMHYKTEKVHMPVASVGGFLKDKTNVRRLDISEFDTEANRLPDSPQTVVLRPAL